MGAGPPLLVGVQVREVGPVSLPGVDDDDAGPASGVQRLAEAGMTERVLETSSPS